ncbi:hypothetical protein N7492_006549 [Penicillium capsulatum]|uniref:Uncharacterized protein n=1 Tax=Penicillium capsulatum TaxID=69766 RepID=A0A9W9I0Z5_9EURO|nr:hypothetical protein N7492_006549 [Penicillium capsulatum]
MHCTSGVRYLALVLLSIFLTSWAYPAYDGAIEPRARVKRPSFIAVVKEAKAQHQLTNPQAKKDIVDVQARKFEDGKSWAIAAYNGCNNVIIDIGTSRGGLIIEIGYMNVRRCYPPDDVPCRPFDLEACEEALLQPLRSKLEEIDKEWGQDPRFLYPDTLLQIQNTVLKFTHPETASNPPTAIQKDNIDIIIAPNQERQSSLDSANARSVTARLVEAIEWDGKIHMVKSFNGQKEEGKKESSDDYSLYQQNGQWYPYGVFPVQMQTQGNSNPVGAIGAEGCNPAVYKGAGCPNGGQCDFHRALATWRQELQQAGGDPDNPIHLDPVGGSADNPIVIDGTRYVLYGNGYLPSDMARYLASQSCRLDPCPRDFLSIEDLIESEVAPYTYGSDVCETG